MVIPSPDVPAVDKSFSFYAHIYITILHYIPSDVITRGPQNVE